LNLRKRSFLSFSKCIGGVAIGTAQVTGGQADKDAGQSGKGAFALQAQVNLVDDQSVGHQRECTGSERNGKAVDSASAASPYWYGQALQLFDSFRYTQICNCDKSKSNARQGTQSAGRLGNFYLHLPDFIFNRPEERVLAKRAKVRVAREPFEIVVTQ